MPELKIGFCGGKEIAYGGADAILLHGTIMDAGQRDSEWTTPVTLKNGYTVILVLENITRIAFKKEEQH